MTNPDLTPDTGAPCANCGHGDREHMNPYPLLELTTATPCWSTPCWFPGCDCRDFEEVDVENQGIQEQG